MRCGAAALAQARDDGPSRGTVIACCAMYRAPTIKLTELLDAKLAPREFEPKKGARTRLSP